MKSFVDYLDIVDDLLMTVYGVTSNDVGRELIAACHKAGETPEECVQQIADKYELAGIAQSMEHPITKTEIRLGWLDYEKERVNGWCFSVYYSGRPYPNFISALFKTKAEAVRELKRYQDTGEFAWYGSAEK